VRWVVTRQGHRLRLGADVIAGGTVGAPQPDAPDLVGVDVAKCLLVQEVLEVRGRVAWVDHSGRGDSAGAAAVLRSAAMERVLAGHSPGWEGADGDSGAVCARAGRI
jgi:hypothetical protein